MDKKRIALASKLMRNRETPVSEVCEAMGSWRATLYLCLEPGGTLRSRAAGRKAQTVRGVYLNLVEGDTIGSLRSPLARPAQWRAFLVMLIANGLRHVPAGTVALEVRGFGMSAGRAFPRERPVDPAA